MHAQNALGDAKLPIADLQITDSKHETRPENTYPGQTFLIITSALYVAPSSKPKQKCPPGTRRLSRIKTWTHTRHEGRVPHRRPHKTAINKSCPRSPNHCPLGSHFPRSLSLQPISNAAIKAPNAHEQACDPRNRNVASRNSSACIALATPTRTTTSKRASSQ